nr:putative integron gene cassette protein [uncultured bacterium]
MNIVSLIYCFIVYLTVGWVSLLIIRSINYDNNGMAFIAAAICAVYTAVQRHHSDPTGENTTKAQLVAAVALGTSALAFGLSAHWILAPFPYPDVTIGISTVGSFGFVFVMFNIFWRSLGPKTN